MRNLRSLPLVEVLLLTLAVILGTGGDSSAASASEPAARPSNPIVSSSSLPLQEARIIIDGAVAYARDSFPETRLLPMGSSKSTRNH